MSVKISSKGLLTPDQVALVELAYNLLKTNPKVPQRYRRRKDYRYVLRPFVRLLKLESPDDLWQFCDITNYDRLIELIRSTEPDWYSPYKIHIFHCVLKNLTAMRYLSKKEWRRKLGVLNQITTLSLSYSQELLRGIVLDVFWKYCEDNPGEIHISSTLEERLPNAVRHFIHFLNLEGPNDFPEFFKYANYEIVVEKLANSALTHKKNIRRLSGYLTNFLYKSFTDTKSISAKGLQKTFLYPREILAEIHNEIEDSMPSCNLLSSLKTRKARILVHKVPLEIEKLLNTWYPNRNTREEIHLSLRWMIEYGKVTHFGELAHFKTFKQFYDNLIIQEGITRQTILKRLESLSSFIQKAIKSQSSIVGTIFRVDYAKALIERQNLRREHNRNICRDKDEIELWISTLPTVEERAIWALYAEALRNIEVLPHEDPYDPDRTIGLRWSQFDPTKRCLTKVRRKTYRDGFKTHAVIRLSEATFKLLLAQQAQQGNNEFIFSLTGGAVRYRYQKHFQRLQEWLIEMESHPTGNSSLFQPLRKLLTRKYGEGRIGVLPHQFRHTWDTLAAENKMQDIYRRYHMAHNLKGGDHYYVHIDKRPEAYFAEYDHAAPKFHYNFSLAKEVYPELS
ncbi:MAG: hypothetical protein ACE5OZ_04235 [Candidatus Heimdallarchaeota archaeon]